MFTGLIEEIGTIVSIKSIGKAYRINVAATLILDDLKIDDSVTLNGACQTVVSRTNESFEVESVEETLRKTTLSGWRTGKKINLERAMKIGDRFGGHIVQGHIDCTGKILSIQKETTGILVWFSFPDEFQRYVVSIGSICINGVSLTIAKAETGRLLVSIIPHTWQKTTFKYLQPGEEVNLEFDILGKYIENLLKTGSYSQRKTDLEKFIQQPDF